MAQSRVLSDSRRQTSVVAAVLIACVAMAMWVSVGGDRKQDLATGLSQLPWLAIGAAALLPALVAIHFISAAYALRAVSDEQLDVRSTTFAQFAAAATNRFVPGGLGGAGVNLRYLLRAGLTPGAAASAMASLAVIGGATDMAFVGALTAGGPAMGLHGATAELTTLTASGMRAGQQHSWVLIATVTLLITMVVVRRRARMMSGLGRGTRDALAHVRVLVARPARWLTAMAASMATTVTVSVGFVLAVDAWGHSATPLPAGALVAIYLVAATAGAATPLPSFFGVTEATLFGALTLGGYSSSSAIVTIVVFRAVSYWLPLPMGLWAGRRLRQANLL